MSDIWIYMCLCLTAFLLGVIVSLLTFGKYLINLCRKVDDDKYKLQEFYSFLIKWIQIRQEGKKINNYFHKNGYKTIAIYGMREIGELLFHELKNSEIKVLYAIDKAADNIYSELPIYKPNDNLEPVDVIVVTAIHYFSDIEAELSVLTDCPVISIEDII